jgi:hypothetical protein
MSFSHAFDQSFQKYPTINTAHSQEDHLVNVLKNLGMTYFAKNVYRRMEILAAAPMTVNMNAEIDHKFDDETCVDL